MGLFNFASQEREDDELANPLHMSLIELERGSYGYEISEHAYENPTIVAIILDWRFGWLTEKTPLISV